MREQLGPFPPQADAAGDLKRALYIYEPADSSFGPSVIENYAQLESFLKSANREADLLESDGAALALDRWDNRDQMHSLRREAARQRLLPSQSQTRRFLGLNSLPKTPLYVDELDPLRPILSWPPLEAGMLLMLPQHRGRAPTLVALPSSQRHDKSSQEGVARLFVAPNSGSLDAQGGLLEQLVGALNCTSAEGSPETRLSLSLNEQSLATDDNSYELETTRQQTPFAGARSQFAAADQRHWLHSIVPTSGSGARIRAALKKQDAGAALRVACRASHSLLLFSSSELITFDFNPSIGQAKNEGDSTHVIQATSGEFTF